MVTNLADLVCTMEVSCPACAARYSADEQKLRGKTARMRCRACDTVWLVSGAGATAPKQDSKVAAVVRRGAERERRDLFATRPPEMGSIKQTLRTPPPEALGVAARNETSVLFTVDALRAAAKEGAERPRDDYAAPHDFAPPPSSLVPVTSDDEGIIDLYALSTRGTARPVAQPLFSEPPPGAFTREVSSSSTSLDRIVIPGGMKVRKLTLAGAGAAMVVMLLACIGLAAAFKGEEPVARVNATSAVGTNGAAGAAAATPAAEATPPVTASTPAPAATVAASEAADDDEADEKMSSSHAPKKKKARAGGKRWTPKASASKAKTSSSSPARPKQAADKCGCKGEFNCILRCAAKGK